ncbi:glycosyl transferase family 2 [Thermoanaerobacterium xylanolyticum LX-11]|uniref:Glycosyl transferase family 2 n=1 Tax=Thermoanaerobacterium xylanolyticum (strain ATCC 49914 / DSM 7097 / LX-11) TaxID=858215 RepID=F6BK37_THEXL|nr:glycosyltransferase [Thermoanaerobacterium xylanolyticum]AEF17032.1 glycosyl transferase family 2 [Thermoanaerobacterium xylanolyticum LX-11]
MSISLLKSIILGFNKTLIYYVFAINFIYFFQLILAAINLNRYIKKIRYSDYRRFISSSNMIPISILVPAYNEEETIVENIKSLLSLHYPIFEVVVINDGSKDNTLKKVIEAFELKEVDQPIRYRIKTNKILKVYRNIDIPNLILVDKENGGKADALNAGINVSNYPVITSIDADSILESDSLVRIIMPFVEDKRTIAVGGIVRIANGSTIIRDKIINIDLPRNRIANFQIVEYLRAFLLGRAGWDLINCLLIVSGAFGACRKDAVIEVGGYDKDTIGEDMELIVKLHEHFVEKRQEYRIKFIPDPVCWTQAPESIKDLRSQRRRWQIGLIDSLFKHKKMLLNPKYKQIGLIAVPYFWLFEMIGPVVEILGYIFIPITYILGILNIKYFILYFAAAILYGVLLSLGAILLEEYTFNNYPKLVQLLKLSIYGVLENFGYRQMTTLFRIEGIVKFKKLKSSWGKIKRHSFETKKA